MIRYLLRSVGMANLVSAYRHMRQLGILGMNQRNHRFISPYNPRALYPLVDDKLKTKHLALEHGVQTPKLVGVIENQHDVSDVADLIAGWEGFCVKPARGSGGKGILVILRQQDGKYYRSNGEILSLSEVQRHVTNILSGLFSLGGRLDVAMIEELIVPRHSLGEFSFEGVPDIRVIVFRGVPVMAMMRLACSASKGKANLHQGAIGVGIDIASGRAINAVQRDAVVSHHPDTQVALSTLVVPDWKELLKLACACYDMSGLGYLGVDLVIDERFGPTLLELNARPGLSIQIANRAGLLPRLRMVEKLVKPDRMRVEDKIRFAQENFAQERVLPFPGLAEIGVAL